MQKASAPAPRLRVLSLGAGVQSTAVLLMALHGEFPDRLDCAVFADTGWEPRAIYKPFDAGSPPAPATSFQVFVTASPGCPLG